MGSLWFSVYLLTASWLFAVPFYEQPHYFVCAALVASGSLLSVVALRRIQVKATRVGAAALLLAAGFAALFVPAPFNVGPAVATLGLACILVGRRATSAGAGFVFAGSILTAQSAAVAAYRVLAPRAGNISPLAQVAGAGLRLLGASVRVGPEGLLLGNGGQTITYGRTLDMFAVLALGVFVAGGCVLLLYGKRRNRAAVATLLGVTVAYAVARFMLFVLMYAVSERIDLFWSASATALSLAPLPFLLARLVRVELRDDLLVYEPPLKDKRLWVATASVVLSVVALLGVVGFHDPGVRKQGRVVMDEAHSDWEWSTQALDTEWFGEKSGYNYYSLYQYLDLFYEMKRNSGAITDKLLSECDVLIIKTPTKPFTSAEIDSVVRFVSAGGGLFLIGDHTNVFGTSTNINPLAGKFGLRFNHDATYELAEGRLSEWEPPAAFPHPIVQYLPTFLFATSCSMHVSASADAVITGYGLKALAADYSQENFFPAVANAPDMQFGLMIQGAAVRHGRGRVAAFSDSTVFSNFWMFMPGKPELALSYIEWLNRTNTPYGAAWVPLLLAAGFAVPFWVVKLRLSRAGVVSALVIGILFAVPAAVYSYARLDHASYPLPDARRDYVGVCFEQEYSDFALPSTFEGFAAKSTDSLHTFFVWNQRLNYFPSAKPTLDQALALGDVVVIANPRKRPDTGTLARVETFVKSGGRLLVMGGAEDPNKAANAFLEPFGMKIDPSAESSASCESAAGGLLALTPAAGIVSGGTGLVSTTTGGHLCSFSAAGDGVVVAFSDSSLFFDASLGNVSRVPTEHQRLAGELEFSLMRFLAEDKPFAF